MEWNVKWERGNMMMFGSKACGSLKELQLTDGGVDEAGELDDGSFNLSGFGTIGVYGSDVGLKASNFTSEAFDDSHGNLGKDVEQCRVELSRHSPPMEASISYDGPFIGLKLGKRTFESNSGGSSVKLPSSSMIPVSSLIAAKKTKSSSQNALIPRCQVEGCNLDLFSAKEYHRKHRVCHSHSKCPKVIIGGVELRFCQQCSRFHTLSDFDEKKRSCRRRLSDHNARRRKPQQETIQFNSRRLSSWFYGVKETMFSLNMGVGPEIPSALSLLSNQSSSEPGSISIGHSTHVNQISMPELVMHAIPRSSSLESTEHWQAEQHLFTPCVHTLVANGHSGGSFQEIQLSADPFDDFYVNGLN